jgi:hypothetical protein
MLGNERAPTIGTRGRTVRSNRCRRSKFHSAIMGLYDKFLLQSQSVYFPPRSQPLPRCHVARLGAYQYWASSDGAPIGIGMHVARSTCTCRSCAIGATHRDGLALQSDWDAGTPRRECTNAPHHVEGSRQWICWSQSMVRTVHSGRHNIEIRHAHHDTDGRLAGTDGT